MPGKKKDNNKKLKRQDTSNTVEKQESKKPKKSALGKGLGALLPNIQFSDKGFKIFDDESNIEIKKEDNLAEIPVSKIVFNPYQPRKKFDEKALEELKNSIIENGVISPITVRRSVNGYELIAGERRLRASVMAGLEKIPAYIRGIDDDVDMLQLALIENLQREDLNPIETANGYRRLINEHNLTQEQVAVKIGKDRSTITNFLRLLKLPQKIQDSLSNGEISTGHARALLPLTNTELMLFAWKEIIKNALSVRATERLVRDLIANKIKPLGDKEKKEEDERKKDGKIHVTQETALVLRDYENKLRHTFATNVKITTKSKESGTIHIDFYSKDDFERILELFSQIENKTI